MNKNIKTALLSGRNKSKFEIVNEQNQFIEKLENDKHIYKDRDYIDVNKLNETRQLWQDFKVNYVAK